MVTKQQLTYTGTLITWQSRSEQHKGKRTRDYKKKGSFLGLSERKMENRPRDAAKSSLMIWRREQLKKEAHEHFSKHTFYFEQLLLLQYLSCFTQCWQEYLGEWRTMVPLLNSGLKDNNFLPLALAVAMCKETLDSEEGKDGCTELQRICRDKWGHSCWSQGWTLLQDVVTRGTYRVYRCGTDSGKKKRIY